MRFLVQYVRRRSLMGARVSAIAHILGLLLVLFSSCMLPPIVVSWLYHDGAAHLFWLAFSMTLGTGLLLWVPTLRRVETLKTRDGFIVVVLFWVVLSLFGALPFALAAYPFSFIDALFESVSGLTTTGTEVMVGLDTLPQSIQFYHQWLQFLGGMGIIVLAVAILPMLGVGGLQLYRAEIPGPMKDHKLAPRLASSAKLLWLIYVGLTVVCAICYYGTGLSFFEALCTSFSTVATGGFSIHDQSMAYYNNHWTDVVGIVFMLLSSLNYGMHYMALQQRSLRLFFEDHETRMFFLILAVVLLLVMWGLANHGLYASWGERWIHAGFTVVSMVTTTGLTNSEFAHWPGYLPVFIMLAALIGGCAGSTTGGVKVVRVLLMREDALLTLRRLIHPRAILSVRFGRQQLPNEVVQAMRGFLATFILLFVCLLLCLMATGMDLTTALGAVSACLSNAGASIGGVADSFSSVSPAGKAILIVAMLAGRLEIFTLLVLFMPSYWER